MVADCKNPLDRTTESKLAGLVARIGLTLHGFWIPAIHAGMTTMSTKRLLQHFDRISEAPDAIPRLRRFILDLAVRGKLVEQDPNDEPAAELLKRIQAEKAKLGLTPRRKGAKKSEKADQEMLGDLVAWREMPFAVPTNWEWMSLGQIIKLWNGYAFKSGDFQTSGVPVIRIGDLQNGEVNIETATRVPSSVADQVTSEIWVPPDALLIAMSGATTGKVAFNRTGLRLLLNQRVGRVDTFNLNISFLKYFFETIIAQNLSISFGTAIPNLSTQQINETPFPLSPLAEQHRIVAKVNELMALCDQLEAAKTEREQSRDRLVAASLRQLQDSNGFTPRHQDAKKDKKTEQENLGSLAPWRESVFLENLPRLTTRPAHIKQLRQTILNLAVRGKLVEQDPSDEPAAELLKQVQDEKARLVKDGKLKKMESQPEVDEDEMPFNLPKSWGWSRLGNVITKLTDGTHHSPPNYQNGDFKYVTAKNIKAQGVSLANITHVSAKIHREIYARCNPAKGDILYIKDGATTGVVTINDIDEPFSMLSSVALLKLPSCLFNRLIVEFLRSPFFYDQMRGFMKVELLHVSL